MPSMISRLTLTALFVVFSLNFASAAAKESVLHAFKGTDGNHPVATLAFDTAGNLYGTTTEGGKYNQGTVFRISASKQETVLYSFCKLSNCTDGSRPYNGVVLDTAGNIYGATPGGGKYGAGVVYKITVAGKYSILHNFKGQPDGDEGYGWLVFDKAGNLYGTTLQGGKNNTGAVYKITPAGEESIFYSFPDGSGDGPLDPIAGLTLDGSGNFYGTSIVGGGSSEAGTVYKLTPAGKETTLYSFNMTNGYEPYAGVTLDPKGNIYGATVYGGSGETGVVYKLSPSGKPLFTYSLSDATGISPYATPILDAKGNIYGVGGLGGPHGYGAVFKMPPSGKSATPLYGFCADGLPNCNDGAEPLGGIVFDTKGNLYGTGSIGGGSGEYGVVFKIVP